MKIEANEEEGEGKRKQRNNSKEFMWNVNFIVYEHGLHHLTLSNDFAFYCTVIYELYSCLMSKKKISRNNHEELTKIWRKTKTKQKPLSLKSSLSLSQSEKLTLQLTKIKKKITKLLNKVK